MMTRLWDLLMRRRDSWKQCHSTLDTHCGRVHDYCQRHEGHWGKHRAYDGRVWK
jgi:hypothetical protein